MFAARGCGSAFNASSRLESGKAEILATRMMAEGRAAPYGIRIVPAKSIYPVVVASGLTLSLSQLETLNSWQRDVCRNAASDASGVIPNRLTRRPRFFEHGERVSLCFCPRSVLNKSRPDSSNHCFGACPRVLLAEDRVYMEFCGMFGDVESRGDLFVT